MQNLTIRKLLLAAFFVAAMLALILGLMSAYTIWLLNGNLRSSSSEIKSNVEVELDSMHSQNSVSELAQNILSATSSGKLRDLDPSKALSDQDNAADSSALRDMKGSLTDLYSAKVNYVSIRESLDANMTDFMAKSENLAALVGSTVENVRDKTLADATASQKSISDKTDSSTRKTLEELSKTASVTLDDTVLVLQIRGKLLELQVAVDAYMRAQTKEKAASISKILADMKDSFGKIPENVAGAFEVADMNGLRDKAEDLLTGKNGILNQVVIPPDSVTKLQQILGDLDAKLLDLADNTVFDGSNNLSSYLQQVSKDLGKSLSTLIGTQKDANSSLTEVSRLQQSTASVKESLYKLLFLVQNASLRCTDKCVSVLKNDGVNLVSQLSSDRRTIVEALGNLGEKEKAAEIDKEMGVIISKAEGKGGIIAQTLNAADAYNRSMAANDAINSKLSDASQKSTASFREFTSRITTAMQEKVVQGGVWMKIQMVFVVFIFVVAITLGIWIGAIVSKRLGEAVIQLFGLSEKLSGSSASLTESSEEQATMASEQAASLEESSSTVEEISSMAERNNEAVSQAAEISNEVLNSTEAGAKKMQNMSHTMDDMNKASAQIGMIIKAIDEIAFQTNILALNAAVEAARAGEAGAGFAVVADEVRSLAIKCKNAAHETEDIIAKNTSLTQEGVKMSASVADSFEHIRQRINELDNLVKEIAHASQEQTMGLGQINQSLATTSSATQKNAAIAQQGAASAQELSHEAENLIETIDSLSQLSGLKMEGHAANTRLAIDDGSEHAPTRPALGASRAGSPKTALPRPSQNGKAKGHFLPQGETKDR
jgi:hypothetical protein